MLVEYHQDTARVHVNHTRSCGTHNNRTQQTAYYNWQTHEWSSRRRAPMLMPLSLLYPRATPHRCAAPPFTGDTLVANCAACRPAGRREWFQKALPGLLSLLYLCNPLTNLSSARSNIRVVIIGIYSFLFYSGIGFSFWFFSTWIINPLVPSSNIWPGFRFDHPVYRLLYCSVFGTFFSNLI